MRVPSRVFSDVTPIVLSYNFETISNYVRRNSSQPNAVSPAPSQTAPSSQRVDQPQRAIAQEDIHHKGFTRLYSEINYEVTPDQDNWNGIAFRIGTFNQQAFGDLKIRIYGDAERQPLVTKSLNLLQIADNQTVRLDFEPIQQSANRTFRIRFFP